MMCPKGHAGAECIIGNFWKCPVCDRTPTSAKRKEGPTLLEIIAYAVDRMWPQKKIDDMASRRGDIPPVVGKFWSSDSSTQHAWWRIELDGHQISRCRHDSRALVDYIDAEIFDAVANVILPDLAQRTAGLRGLHGRGVESMAGLGVPHWVADDGQILVRVCAETFELRMRAIWRPAP